jgi:hypothetical protein
MVRMRLTVRADNTTPSSPRHAPYRHNLDPAMDVGTPNMRPGLNRPKAPIRAIRGIGHPNADRGRAAGEGRRFAKFRQRSLTPPSIPRRR